MKVKVIASIELKNIPDNYIIIDVPDEVTCKEAYAANLVREQLANSDIAIVDDKHIIPKQLIKNIDVKSYIMC